MAVDSNRDGEIDNMSANLTDFDVPDPLRASVVFWVEKSENGPGYDEEIISW